MEKIKHAPTPGKALTSRLRTRLEWTEKGNETEREKRGFSNSPSNTIVLLCWNEYEIDGSKNMNTT